MGNFNKGLTSETVVDESQQIDPNRIRAWLQKEAILNLEDKVVVGMLQELVDLADHSGFLNAIRQERMDMTVRDMMGNMHQS